MTHPEGALGRFDIKEQCHNQTEVPKIRRLSINNYSSVFDDYFVLPGSVLYSLSRKTLTFQNQQTYVWNYNYSQTRHAFKGEELTSSHRLDVDFYGNDNAHLKSTTVTNPDGSQKSMYFERRYAHGHDLLFSEWYSSNGSLKMRESYKYIDGYNPGQTGIYFYAGSARDPYTMADLVSAKTPQSLTTEIKKELFDELGDSTTYQEKRTDFNQYDIYRQTEIFNSFSSNKRYIKTEFKHDTSQWLLNFPTKHYASTSSSFDAPYKETIYNSKLQPYQEKTMGKLISTKTYHIDGTLKKRTYNGSSRYEQFDDYYRGKARKVTLPCAITNGCNTANGSGANTMIAKLEVNGDSSTKSVTDFNGYKTSYSYNPIGWLTKVDYADGKWSDKVISYATVTTANDGIAGSGIVAGQLKQTITQGNFEQKIYHDDLLRPTFTRTHDNADSSTISYQRTDYDHDNRPTLQTFPSSSASNTIGMTTEYDALGRVITSTRLSDNAFTTVEYLSGNKKRVTDAEHNATTTTYLAYGSPSYDKPTLIEAPDTSNTAIAYNTFGQVTSITQGSVTEKRLYDSYQQLCKTYRPETGVTAYGYNAQRQPLWHAEGTNGGSSSCAASSVPESHKVHLGYDNLGQLRTQNFPDSSPDNTYGYDANGNLASLVSGSGSGAISWSYLYNSLNLIEKETLSIDSKNFVLDWAYNNLGAVSSLKYPTGRTISYSPNALGQPTKASEGSGSATVNYASNVKYYPNGQLKQMTYGNGIVRDISLDTSGRIAAIMDVKSGSQRLDLDPRYDKNDNLVGLIDWRDRSNDIDNMSYDGLDRLKSANGKWGSGNYTYDGLGNIKTRSISGSSITYHYNSANRLNNLTGAYAYSYGYDPRGNVTHNGRYSLSFNRANQLTAAKGLAYRYDGHNRRVKKQGDYSVYSQAGQLLNRISAINVNTDVIYLSDKIIAEIDKN
ncbi:YD repeat protein (fragment) [Shewanella benthica]|uniref:YD repeat protein n=1 Tax=Shewanella benthica TaxID=43661 RepID=A0A330M3J0_9GAMM